MGTKFSGAEGCSPELRPHVGPGVKEPPSVLLAEKYYTNTWYTLAKIMIMDSKVGEGGRNMYGNTGTAKMQNEWKSST